jgi:hypothetical protein
MGVEQCAAIFVQAGGQRPDGAGPGRDALGSRKAFSMLLESLGAEDLTAYQLNGLGGGGVRRSCNAAQDGHHQRAESIAMVWAGLPSAQCSVVTSPMRFLDSAACPATIRRACRTA